jgi:nitroreductase
MKRPVHERLDLLYSRYSCRKFGADPVDPEDLGRLRQALQWAPSAGNAQPWLFYEISDRETRAALAAAALGQHFIADAPLVYAICADPDVAERAYGKRGRTFYVLQDTAAATMCLLIAAHGLGYGACWVGAFDEERVARALDLPESLRPVALVPVGRPAEADQCPGRKSEAGLFRFIH